MMHQGMDLSRFKRVSSDGKSTILRHSKGHEVKIAHSGLSPKMKAQIEALQQHEEEPRQMYPDGGLVQANDPNAQPPRNIPPKPAVMPQAGTINVQGQRPQAQPQPQPQPAPMQPAQPQPPMDPRLDPNYLKIQDALWDQDLKNGHVEPLTYKKLFEREDTLGKIGTLFGLMVSGVGSGLTGKPNAVMEMMNEEIKNDFEAQKQSKSNAYNILEHNRQQFMDVANIQRMMREGQLTAAQAKALMTDAAVKGDALTQMQKNRAALAQLTQMAQKYPPGSPQRQQADQILGMLYQGINAENGNLADRAYAAGALMNTLTGQQPQAEGQPMVGGMQQTSANPEQSFQGRATALRLGGQDKMAQDMESKHMPGVEGQASIPLTTEDRSYITAGLDFQHKLDEMRKFIDEHKGIKKLNLPDRERGEAMAGELQTAYRIAKQGGVYKEGEQKFIEKFIDSTPTKFFDEIRVTPGLDVVQKNSKNELNTFLKGKGFKGLEAVKDMPKGSQPKEGQTGKDKKTGKPVVFKGGKWVYAK